MTRSTAPTPCAILIGSLALLVLHGPARSDEGGLPRSVADRLSAQPDVRTARRVDGTVTVTEWTRNGVTLHQEQDGSKVTSYATDASGKGAVACSWMIEVEARARLRTCPSMQNQELRVDLDDAVDAIDAFIVANSLEPTTLAALHAREAAADAAARGAAPPANPEDSCSSGEIGALIAAMGGSPRAERRKRISDLLSIPRWPVSNPCF